MTRPDVRPHLGGDAFQLLDDEPVQQRDILEETAAILGEQVAQDRPAGRRIGVQADEDRTPIRRRDVHAGLRDKRFAACSYQS
jgi:hypothetical protein